jgi:hypothetical protein
MIVTTGTPNESHREAAPLVQRAPRFAIRTPVQFRESGQGTWSEGTTVNISRSGVLFNADNLLERETMLEMRIIFPAEVTGAVPMSVVCWGPVVRKEFALAGQGSSAVAAAIFHYRFTHE